MRGQCCCCSIIFASSGNASFILRFHYGLRGCLTCFDWADGRLGLRRYRRFCLLGLRLVAGHRQEGQPLGLPQNALASPPKRQILKIALKSGLGLMLFGMTKAI